MTDTPTNEQRKAVSLREAIESGVIRNLTYNNAKKLRQRDPEFPKPTGRDNDGISLIYDPDELARWERDRADRMAVVPDAPIVPRKVREFQTRLNDRTEYDPDAVESAIDALPRPMQACAYLILSAIVARRYLSDVYTEGHLGFMAIGESGTGKTALAKIVCHLLGLDRLEHMHMLPKQVAGSVGGRRLRTGGMWDYAPPPEFELPFVFLDEWDKASEPLQRSALQYFQGDTQAIIEGRRFNVRPTPMLAANPGSPNRYGFLRPEYRRRCVVLDTGDINRREIERILRTFFTTVPAGIVPLDWVPQPAEFLSAEAEDILALIPYLLTEDGESEFPGVPFLRTVTLGFAALFGRDRSDRWCAHQVGAAYLIVSATVVDQVRAGWWDDWREVGALIETENYEALESVIIESQTERKRKEYEQKRHRLAKLQADKESFDREKVATLDIVTEHIELWDTRKARREYRDKVRQIRAAFVVYRQAVDKANSWEALREVIEKINTLANQVDSFADTVWPDDDGYGYDDSVIVEGYADDGDRTAISATAHTPICVGDPECTFELAYRIAIPGAKQYSGVICKYHERQISPGYYPTVKLYELDTGRPENPTRPDLYSSQVGPQSRADLRPRDSADRAIATANAFGWLLNLARGTR